jgi:undecaprenyl diphosphate synthase
MNVPKHIGIILDGNGRWAKSRGLPRTAGHRKGTDAAHRIVQASGELGISYLTIYVFSTENWGRPHTEVSMLMDLLVEMVRKEIRELHKNNVRLHSIGDLSRLPPKTRRELEEGIESTKNNSGLSLILAINYGGRVEIVRAAKKFAEEAVQDPSIIEKMDEKSFSRYMYTCDFPDPDLIIRTGGEMRISNFLLWQSAYSEFYTSEVPWPDFDKKDLEEAIAAFNSRDRRYGKVKE